MIVDLVLNHTSIDHPWFQDARTPGSEHDDWYSGRQPASRSPAPAASASGTRTAIAGTTAFFWEGMPDLNVANPEVVAALDEVARFWLDDMGVDGFRLDAARHLIEDGDQTENSAATFAWLEDFRGRLKADHPDALVLGEVFDATSMSSQLCPGGLARPDVRLRPGGRNDRGDPLGRWRIAPGSTTGSGRVLPAGRPRHVPDQPRPEPDRGPAGHRMSRPARLAARSCSQAQASRSSTTARRSG